MSKFVLPIAELKPALIGLGKVISKKSTLPVLKHIRVERTKDGWITLTATDLESYVTVRLEQPSPGEPETILVQDRLLSDLVKTCRKDESISLEQVKNQIVAEYKVGNGTGKQPVESLPAIEFPEIPKIKSEPIKIPDSVRVAILEAFECASVDETRYVLNGAFIDVDDPKCHQVVGTDGKHLYGSNSFKLPLEKSLIIPTRRFFSWKEFSNDGEWQLRIGTDSNHLLFQISSRRWRIITRQIDGNYPNYRCVYPDENTFRTDIVVAKDSAEEIAKLVARIPCSDEGHQTIGLQVSGKQVYLCGKHPESIEWESHELTWAKATGRSGIVYLNRTMLVKALRFGMTRIYMADAQSPVKITGGGKMMIIMPVRVLDTTAPKPEINPVKEETVPPQAEAVNSETEPSAVEPEAESAQTKEPMTETTTTESPSAVDQAIELVDTVRDQLQEGLNRVRKLQWQLKQLQKDQKNTTKEIQSFRNRLKDLQSIRI